MRGSKVDLPLAEDYGENFRSWQSEWGGMIVEISLFPAGVDAAPLFKGPPTTWAMPRTGDTCLMAACA